MIAQAATLRLGVTVSEEWRERADRILSSKAGGG
jgi:hypothetical protein